VKPRAQGPRARKDAKSDTETHLYFDGFALAFKENFDIK
jgi:hypothetical protein